MKSLNPKEVKEVKTEKVEIKSEKIETKIPKGEIVTLTNINWKEIKREGNWNCPKCKHLLVVIPVTNLEKMCYQFYGFCGHCNSIFKAEEEAEPPQPAEAVGSVEK